MSAADSAHAGRRVVLAGIGLAVLSYFVFTLHDAAIKWLVVTVPAVQILFFRSATVLVGCCLLGGRRLFPEALATPVRGALLLRGLIILGAWLCYYTAAKDLQLAELLTLYFVAPIMVAFMARPLLGERITPVRWGAAVTGFAGVVIACDPARLGLTAPVLLVLLSALLWAVGFILIRRISTATTTILQMFYGNLVFLVATGTALVVLWRTPAPLELGMMVLVGVLGGIAQFSLFEGIRRVPASVLAPFEYTALIWGFLLGFAIWGDVPRREVFIGAALICAAGLLVIWSERRAARVAPVVPQTISGTAR